MLLDAHTHLDEYINYENGQILEHQALKDIEELQIKSLANSMDIPSYEKNLELSQRNELIIPSFGIHPWRAAYYEDSLDKLEPYIHNSEMIGEIGLDFQWTEKETFKSQVKVFEFFLDKIQKGTPKIMNLHTKGAEREIIQLLKKYRSERAIIHWYSGPRQELRELIDMGCYFTISVEVKYSDFIGNIAREIPLDKLLMETDNPSGEQWLSKETGMPRHITGVYKKVAQIRNMDPIELEQKVWQNFMSL